jgi:hypothetical protein
MTETTQVLNSISSICLKVLRIILKRSKKLILIIYFYRLIIFHENLKIFMIKLLFLNGMKIKRNF